MADDDEDLTKTEKVIRLSTKCCFFQSPFVDISEKAYRMLVVKYRAHVVCLPAMNASCVGEEWLRRLQVHEEDRCVVKIVMDDEESVIKAAGIIQECLTCHVFALDISLPQTDNSTLDDEMFPILLKSIQSLHTKISLPVACKLLINLDDIYKTITMAEQLHRAGCKVIFLHARINGDHKPSVLKKKDWNEVKKIRDSVPKETFLVLETGCQSVHEVKQCLSFTGVDGVATAEPLLWNPALFLGKRLSPAQIMKDYVDLCMKCTTQLGEAKETILKFSGYFINRYSGMRERLVSAMTFDELDEVVASLDEELRKLSKKQAKCLGRLQQKKEHYRMKKKSREETIKIPSASGESGDQSSEDHLSKREIKQVRKVKVMSALLSGQRVAIDLSLEEHMTDKELTKVAGQIRRLYGSNLKSSHPFHVYLTGMDRTSRIFNECTRQNDGFENYLIDMSEKKVSELFDSDNAVYLSPDSQNILNELDEHKVYVIGGLVDHKVIKGVSLGKAGSSNINTARLPIDKYMQKGEPGNHNYSRVLTINQVFDILLKFHETKEWVQALSAGVPKRKGFVLKQSTEISSQT